MPILETTAANSLVNDCVKTRSSVVHTMHLNWRPGGGIADRDPHIARRAGELRGQLLTRGRNRSQADMLIVVTARIHALTIDTRNVRDFDGCGVGVLNPFVA